jgi:hypothetical protein
MVNINWQFQTMIAGGPAFTLAQPVIQADGYDVTALTLAASTSNIAVPIQPATGAGDVVFLVVSCSQYDPGISYTVDGLGIAHVLDGPHTFVGSEAVGFLNSAAPPQKLTFSNTLANPIDVQVVAGRKVA